MSNAQKLSQTVAGGVNPTTTNTTTSVDNEIVLFSGTGGKTLKRASTTGLLKATSGVIGAAVSGTDIKTINGTSLLGSGNLSVGYTGETEITLQTTNNSVAYQSSTTGAVSESTVVALSATSLLVVYSDNANSAYGTACVLTISGSTITAGTPVVFESANTSYISATALDSTKVLVAYRDAGNSGYGTACVLTVSGTTVSAGTPAVFKSASTEWVSLTSLDATKGLVTYLHGGTTYVACVLSVSGTTVTANAEASIEANVCSYPSISALDTTKAIFTYKSTASSGYLLSRVLSVSGTTVTVGASTTCWAENTSSYGASVVALSATVAVVVYSGGTAFGLAQVLSISGTTITANPPSGMNLAGGYSAYFSSRAIAKVDATNAVAVINGSPGISVVNLAVSGTSVTASSMFSAVKYGIYSDTAYAVAYPSTDKVVITAGEVPGGRAYLIDRATYPYAYQLTTSDGQLIKVTTDGQDGWIIRLPNPSTLTTGTIPYVIQNRSRGNLVLQNHSSVELCKIPYATAASTQLNDAATAEWAISFSELGLPKVSSVSQIKTTGGTFSIPQIASVNATTCHAFYVGEGAYPTTRQVFLDGSVSPYTTQAQLSVAAVGAGSSTVLGLCALDENRSLVVYNDSGASVKGSVVSGYATTMANRSIGTLYGGNATQFSVAKLTTNKVIVCWRQDVSSNWGIAQVVTIGNDQAVTAGSSTTFESATTFSISVAALSDTVALVTYGDGGNANAGTACVLTISGTSPSAGTPAVFYGGGNIALYGGSSTTKVMPLSATTAFVVFKDSRQSLWGCVLTVSGTTVSAGTAYRIGPQVSSFSAAKLTSTKFVVVADSLPTERYNSCLFTVTVSGTVVTPSSFVFFSKPTGYSGVEVTAMSATQATFISTYNPLGVTEAVVGVINNL